MHLYDNRHRYGRRTMKMIRSVSNEKKKKENRFAMLGGEVKKKTAKVFFFKVCSLRKKH